MRNLFSVKMLFLSGIQMIRSRDIKTRNIFTNNVDLNFRNAFQ